MNYSRFMRRVSAVAGLSVLTALSATAAEGPGSDAAAKQPTLQERCIADSEALDARLSPNYSRDKAASFDWLQAGREVAQLGANCPEFDGYQLRNLVGMVLRNARRNSAGQGMAVTQLFSSSSSTMFREMAAGEAQVEALKTTPLQLRFTAVDGREVDLEKLRGKVVLINFWAATWCGACKVQEPLLKEVYQKYSEQGFEVIGISCEMKEGDRQFLLDYVKEHNMTWPQFFDGQAMLNPHTRRFGFIGIPQYFLINKQGLLAAHSHSSGGLRNLEAVVRRELGLEALDAADERKVLGGPATP